MIKVIYSKPTANIKLNRERLKVIPLKSARRQNCPLFLFNIVLKVLAQAVSQQKVIKGRQIRRKRVKLALFADDMILYIRDHKNPSREFLKLITLLVKWQDTRLTQKQSNKEIQQ